jgi:thioester reductase-like protein
VTSRSQRLAHLSLEEKRTLLARLLEEKRRKLQSQPNMALPESPAAVNDQTSAVDAVDLQAEAVLDSDICVGLLPGKHVTEPAQVFLTGSTGFLGAFLLHELLQQTKAQIYCLVRAANAAEGRARIQKNLHEYALWSEPSSPRILPVLGDLAKPCLGMPADQFQQLARDIDAIYHNGALVNFFYPYSTLKPANVQGTRAILRLASHVRPKPVHYISSSSVFPVVDNSAMKIIREEDTPEPGPHLLGGYAQSKWVAEKLITIAGARGLPVSIYRPGMISGHSQTGISNQKDFLWWLLQSCIYLGQAPDLDIVADMAPVDFVSRAIVYLSQQEKSLGKTFHIGNAEKVHVRQIRDWVCSYGYQLQQVTYRSWRAALLRLATDFQLDSWAPFLQLIRSVEEDQLTVPRFECQNTLAGLAGSSITCPPASPALWGTYLAYFMRCGGGKMPSAPAAADGSSSS